MGYQKDQRLPNEQAKEKDSSPPPAYAPPLPPRKISDLNLSPGRSSSPDLLDPNALHIRVNHSPYTWSTNDPRDASTESLVNYENTDKRKLMLIYIHGFMGNETSFRSFPAHAHNLTTQLVEETHVVHTKIYPRYKSRRAIEFVRDDFSEW
jgi:hypothetical protein